MCQKAEAAQRNINTVWGNGSPGDFDSPSHGSNPCTVATLTQKVPIICVRDYYSKVVEVIYY